MFYRTVRMVDNGIKPVYVFDGKPPTMKSGELAKRKARKADAQAKMEEANETGTAEDVARFTKRTVRVTPEHNDECKRLLKTMGIPYVEAPCEAEAQCAELARAGKVYAAASEDMDTLTFSSPILLRHLTFSEQRKLPIDEVNLEATLAGLDMTMPQFIDLCILLGCDYVETIKGVGPSRAFTMIKEYGSIEKALPHLPEKLTLNIPTDWKYDEARQLFSKPDVTPGDTFDLKWEAPDIEAVVDFLVKEKGFSEDRIRKGCEKLTKNLKQATQSRMMDFFKAKPTDPADKKKRAAPPTKKDAKKRKGKK
ncbi:unnamed protein product [Absidia cylindrospora]